MLCYCLLILNSFFYVLGQPICSFLSVIFMIHIYWAWPEFYNYFQCLKILNIGIQSVYMVVKELYCIPLD